MATINIRDQNRVLDEPAEISDFLSQFGIWYRRFEGPDTLGDDVSADEVLAAYDEPRSRSRSRPAT